MNRVLWAALIAAMTLFCACDNEDSGSQGGSVLPMLQIVTTTLPPGQPGLPYSTAIEATGGTGAGYTWSVIAGSMPANLTLGAQSTPNTTLTASDGDYYPAPGRQFTIQVEDSAGNKAHMPYAYISDYGPPPPPPSPPSIVTTNLPNTVLGSPYLQFVHAAGTTSYSWSLVMGNLPPGLALGATTTSALEIYGTPTQLGTYHFTLHCASAGGYDEQQYTIVVEYPYSFPFSKNYLFVCDLSVHTSGTVNNDMRYELTAILQGLSYQDEFDIMVYNDSLQGGRQYLWGSLMPATQGNVAAAITWLNSAAFQPAGDVSNTLYDAWEDSFNHPAVDHVLYFFHYVAGHGAAVLADLPTWAAPYPNRENTFVGFSPDGAAATFGQQAASITGGTYIAV